MNFFDYYCWFMILCGQAAILLRVSSSSEGNCRTVRFIRQEKGKALVDHVIANPEVSTQDKCELRCYFNDDCVSFNFGLSKTGDDYICELNNSTDQAYMKIRKDFTYRGTPNTCHSSPCMNDAKCQYGFTAKTFRCLCSAGFDGELCEKDVDECGSSPCMNGGSCSNLVNGYNCSCQSGFNGSNCEIDIDECKGNTHNCSTNAWCNNTAGSFGCNCKAGFFGDGINCMELQCETVFDFENGVSGWTLTGTAFNNQPTYGDNPTARGRVAEPSNHKGDWWIGGTEDRPSSSQPAGATQGDGPQGSMTSPSFVIAGNLLKFLIGGGCDKQVVRAELIVEGKLVLQETGNCNETMTEKSWDVSGFTGKQAQLRLIDNSSGGWGHINFDHLICH